MRPNLQVNPPTSSFCFVCFPVMIFALPSSVERMFSEPSIHPPTHPFNPDPIRPESSRSYTRERITEKQNRIHEVFQCSLLIEQFFLPRFPFLVLDPKNDYKTIKLNRNNWTSWWPPCVKLTPTLFVASFPTKPNRQVMHRGYMDQTGFEWMALAFSLLLFLDVGVDRRWKLTLFFGFSPL